MGYPNDAIRDLLAQARACCSTAENLAGNARLAGRLVGSIVAAKRAADIAMRNFTTSVDMQGRLVLQDKYKKAHKP